MTEISFIAILFAILGGVLPTLAWLLFWLREDKTHPEPKKMIALAFLGGIVAVLLSLCLEKLINSINIDTLFSFKFFNPFLHWMESYANRENLIFKSLLMVTVFAPIIEEIIKYVIAYIFVLKSREDDEPIDPVIYMITIALGFAAIENTFFLIDPFVKNDVIMGILTGNMRFVGATLLHIISSATIGLFIGFNFFDSKIKKFFWTLAGLLSAIALHSLFNFFIINNEGSSTFAALEVIWVIVIIILLLLEKLKK